MKEAQSINTSLSALGNVILNLGKGEKFISFRECKLTRILQNSLKGDSKISLLATVSSKEDDTNETLSTLNFANRCKQILINPEDKISIEINKSEETFILNQRLKEIENHYQQREENLLNEIECLKRLSHANNSPANGVVVVPTEKQSETSQAFSFKQTFDIEEVVRAHPEIKTQKFKKTIMKQERYIEYLNKILFDILDETSYLMSSSLNSPTEAKDFRERILAKLTGFQNFIEESVDEDEIFNFNEK